MYLPVCLASSRLYYCSEGKLSADPSVECWSGPHFIIGLICVILTVPLFVGLPLLFYEYVYDSVIYDAEFDHEKRLQAWEMEYAYRLGNYFQSSQLWLCSSFRRHSAYFTIILHGFKAYILLLFLLCRFSTNVQASLFWFGTFFALSYAIYNRPYRLNSTNIELCTLVSLLFVNATFGVFNAFGVQNSVLVASTETLMLLSFHAAGLCVLVLLLLYGICAGAKWPAQRTMQRLQNSNLWPSVVAWMETIQEAQAVDLDCYKCLPEAVDIIGLEQSIRCLRRDWCAASSVGTVFTVIIRENLEQLLLTHSHFLPFALRRHEYLDKVWVDGGGEAFRRRGHTYRLTNPKKRSIITKLFALKAFIGNRVINREISEDGSVDDEEPQTDEYGMDMDKHRRLAALLLGDQENADTSKLQRGRRKSVQELQEEKKLQLKIWSSAEDYDSRKLQLTTLSSQTEEFLQQYKFKYQNSANLSILPGSSEVEMTLQQFSTLYQKWHEVIEAYERRDLPGGGLFTALDEEEWLTYRFTLQEKWKDFENRLRSERDDDRSRNDPMTIEERSELGSDFSEEKGEKWGSSSKQGDAEDTRNHVESEDYVEKNVRGEEMGEGESGQDLV